MKVVEVIKTDETDPVVLAKGMKWVEEIGKVSVLCDDTPGAFKKFQMLFLGREKRMPPTIDTPPFLDLKMWLLFSVLFFSFSYQLEQVLSSIEFWFQP